MMIKRFIFVLLFICASTFLYAQSNFDLLEKQFQHPDLAKRPWVIWYWMHGAISKEGIKADLQAMHDVGIEGAYLMFIKDTSAAHFYKPAFRQLSGEWYDMVKYAASEAKHQHIKIGIHISDGFALAAGPWITPELSMQKVVWSTMRITGKTQIETSLPVPSHYENYYKDIAVYAIRQDEVLETTSTSVPVVSTSNASDASFLPLSKNDQTFKSDSSLWIQYAFGKPFTCRTVLIRPSGANVQSMRLLVQSSEDGIHFTDVKQLEPPRHGWQNVNPDMTFSIPSTTAKYFRFVYNKDGVEPGSEDLDNAKWKANLKIKGILLSSEALIDQYRGKSGEVWRISKPLTDAEFPKELCKQKNEVINITTFFKDGKLIWNAPEGNWLILRMGQTSTGQKNETAGGGKGLECDKFNPGAIKMQVEHWFDEIVKHVGAENKSVIDRLHIDSWECGSQNWSDQFADEFKKRRGYDLMQYLPLYAGIPIESVALSEKVLSDVRLTIADLLSDVFFKTVKGLAVERNVRLSAESTAPTMVGDGMLHYKYVDLPMGEFWLKSPTHDKPNDMLDAISAAHLYNKKEVQSESFTQLRLDWDEHPAMMKAEVDRNFTLGINSIAMHVFVHNPWIDKKPGYTLDGIGSYFQRDQIWFKQGKVWLDYLSRIQSILQSGNHVADIAVYTGDEIPRRAVLPDRLIHILGGLIGESRVNKTIMQMKNEGQPTHQLPAGVSSSSNMVDPKDWVNPLNGYAYDSFNPDALSQSTMKNGQLYTSSGAHYKIFVLAGGLKMNPGNKISKAAVNKLIQHIGQGLTVIMDEVYLPLFKEAGCKLNVKLEKGFHIANLGKGRVVVGPIEQNNLNAIGLQQDVVLPANIHPASIGYVHRVVSTGDIYFISNQLPTGRDIEISFRTNYQHAELWNPITGEIRSVLSSVANNSRSVKLHLDSNGSMFVVFKNTPSTPSTPSTFSTASTIQSPWMIKFDTAYLGPKDELHWDELMDWTSFSDTLVKYYSGSASYKNTFTVAQLQGKVSLKIDQVNNLATIKINGKDCGTMWTPPYQVDISSAVKKGLNTLEIIVTNTWANRLNRDQQLKNTDAFTFTTSPYSIAGRKLIPAGITGKVSVVFEGGPKQE